MTELSKNDPSNEVVSSINNGFFGQVFQPRTLWGDNSEIANYLLKLPPQKKVCVTIKDIASLNAGWPSYGEKGTVPAYAPAFTAQNEDPRSLVELYNLSIEVINAVDLYPFIKGYVIITPKVVFQDPRETLPHNNADNKEATKTSDYAFVTNLFKNLGVEKDNVVEDKIFQATHKITEKTRAVVFAARVIVEMTKNYINIENFIQEVTKKFSYSEFQVVSDIKLGVTHLFMKKSTRCLGPIFISQNVDSTAFYNKASNLLAELSLLEIKHSPNSLEHTFFPYNAESEEEQLSKLLYPQLMKAYAIFCASIPEYIPEKKEYNPNKITSDVRALYNLFFKLFNVDEQLGFRPIESTANNEFLKRCKKLKSQVMKNINQPNFKGDLEKTKKEMTQLFDHIETIHPLLEANLNIPHSRLALYNKKTSARNVS